MASDMLRFAARFYEERFVNAARHPLDWRKQSFLVGSLVGLPLVSLPLVGAMMHFVEEARFNRSLLFDLVARPALAERVDTRVLEVA
jgi:hypothetical protein